MPDCNPTEQQARQDQLEALYAADGRHDPAHPMHCLYTGLVLGISGPAPESAPVQEAAPEVAPAGCGAPAP